MSVFKDWLGGAGNTLLWVEYEAYARRVFANAPPDWYSDPVRFAATLIQAQSVIGSQCLSVDVLAPSLSSLENADAPLPAEAIIDALGSDAPAEFIVQAFDALLHRFGGQLDLFIKLRTPASLLGAGDDAASINFDDLDDLASVLSNLIRSFADKSATGVLLVTDGDASLTSDEVDAYEPIVSAARHYDWCTVMSFPHLTSGATPEVQLDLDAMVLPQCPLESIAAETRDPRTGGGLTDAFWSGAAISAAESSGRLLYGCIPESAIPETVLSVLADLG